MAQTQLKENAHSVYGTQVAGKSDLLLSNLQELIEKKKELSHLTNSAKGAMRKNDYVSNWKLQPPEHSMAPWPIDPNEIASFMELDTHNRGRINRFEWKKKFGSEEGFDELDLNHDGTVDYHEWMENDDNKWQDALNAAEASPGVSGSDRPILDHISSRTVKIVLQDSLPSEEEVREHLSPFGSINQCFFRESSVLVVFESAHAADTAVRGNVQWALVMAGSD